MKWGNLEIFWMIYPLEKSVFEWKFFSEHTAVCNMNFDIHIDYLCLCFEWLGQKNLKNLFFTWNDVCFELFCIVSIRFSSADTFESPVGLIGNNEYFRMCLYSCQSKVQQIRWSKKYFAVKIPNWNLLRPNYENRLKVSFIGEKLWEFLSSSKYL